MATREGRWWDGIASAFLIKEGNQDQKEESIQLSDHK